MPSAFLLLFVANVVFATSYGVTRVVLDDVPPATLGLARSVIGAVILVGWASRALRATTIAPRDHGRIALMGVVGFALAFGLGNWGIAHSTASNAALLITVEPTSLLLLSPALLGERLTRREALGAALALLGTVIVVVNGIPGLTRSLAPHWRGDLLLILSGLAYAAYSLLGRPVLASYPVLVVTAWSIVWGALTMVPLAWLEWHAGLTPRWTTGAVLGALYLGVVITALGYAVWNWCLERLGAARVAIFVNVQPLAGALIGVWWLREPLTVFTVVGGLVILTGLHLTVKAGGRE
ncbi:MAG TPA: DMT family transporter [Methylomirabilota bacterium]|jgi:drug/metabolite transporter (DMT)-like permease